MARGRGSKVEASGRESSGWTTFIDLPLEGHSIDDVLGRYGAPDQLFDALGQVLETGHRVSLAYNYQNDSVTASMTGKGDGCPNVGLTVTSYAEDWVTALQVAMYKHFVIAGGHWEKNAKSVTRGAFG